VLERHEVLRESAIQRGGYAAGCAENQDGEGGRGAGGANWPGQAWFQELMILPVTQ
jgi:hypothetical protein